MAEDCAADIFRDEECVIVPPPEELGVTTFFTIGEHPFNGVTTPSGQEPTPSGVSDISAEDQARIDAGEAIRNQLGNMSLWTEGSR